MEHLVVNEDILYSEAEEHCHDGGVGLGTDCLRSDSSSATHWVYSVCLSDFIYKMGIMVIVS